MERLDEKQLEKVAGGSTESQITLILDLSQEKLLSGDITIKPYVNGELKTSMIKVVDESVTSVSFVFKGRGKVEVKFKINEDIFKYYELDFDAGISTQK